MYFESLFKSENGFVINKGDEVFLGITEVERYGRDIELKDCNIVYIKSEDEEKTGFYNYITGKFVLPTKHFDNVEIRRTMESYGYKKYPKNSERMYFFEVQKDGKCGVYSTDGEQILPLEFKEGILHFDGKFVAKSAENKLFGVYSTEGVLLVPHEYGKIDLELGYIKGINRNKIKLYFSDGREVFPFLLKSVTIHSACMVVQEYGGYYGLYSRDGEEIIPREYTEMRVEADGYVKAKKDGYAAILYKDGRELIPAGEYIKIYKKGEMFTAETEDKNKKLIFCFKDGKYVD